MQYGYFFFFKNNKQTTNNLNNNNYSSTKISSTNENINTNNENKEDKNISSTDNKESSTGNTPNEKNNPPAPKETLISEFATKIYTKDSERQNNISITCSSLNDTTINPGETFSFCETVGKATSSKGYEKADVYKNGEVVQALGGGNCQVSTTLYNAVLKNNDLKVTERHAHSNSVPYITKGKDAAVAYGSYDLKFINNTGNKIKITSSTDKDYVYVKLYKIE